MHETQNDMMLPQKYHLSQSLLELSKVSFFKFILLFLHKYSSNLVIVHNLPLNKVIYKNYYNLLQKKMHFSNLHYYL